MPIHLKHLKVWKREKVSLMIGMVPFLLLSCTEAKEEAMTPLLFSHRLLQTMLHACRLKECPYCRHCVFVCVCVWVCLSVSPFLCLTLCMPLSVCLFLRKSIVGRSSAFCECFTCIPKVLPFSDIQLATENEV